MRPGGAPGRVLDLGDGPREVVASGTIDHVTAAGEGEIQVSLAFLPDLGDDHTIVITRLVKASNEGRSRSRSPGSANWSRRLSTSSVSTERPLA